MLREAELYYVDLINGKRRGPFAFILKFFLLILSWFYRLLIFCRNWAFDHGWMKRYSPPVPVVISIGNIVAGGTGKTPVTLMLAKAFCDEFTIAILSRGYRSKAEKLPVPIVLSRGDGPLHAPSYCGDEP